jgi:hypothetical protein
MNETMSATAYLGRSLREGGAFYLAWAREHQNCFVERFWDERHGGLYDVITPEGPRAGIAPAHVLAVSLGPPLLPPAPAARRTTGIERELFTPFGLKTHAGADSVLPEWLRPFASAYLRVHGRSDDARAQVHALVRALDARLVDSVAGHVPAWVRLTPEAIDAPPRRAPASTLAAAELLRAWVEEVDHADEAVAAR